MAQDHFEAGILVKSTAVNQAHHADGGLDSEPEGRPSKGIPVSPQLRNGRHGRMEKDEGIQLLRFFKDRPILLFVQVAVPVIGIRLPSLEAVIFHYPLKLIGSPFRVLRSECRKPDETVRVLSNSLRQQVIGASGKRRPCRCVQAFDPGGRQ
jgi:hypothetical protein